MAYWFEKDNIRRFRRIQLPIQAMVCPQQPLTETDILGYGTDYLPPSVQSQIEQSRKALWHWVSHIQDQQACLKSYFEAFEQAIIFFGDCLNRLAKGESQRRNPEHWYTLQDIRKGIQKIEVFQATAPKIFAYFDALNTKIMTYFAHLMGCDGQSTLTQFKPASPLPKQFEIDKIANRFDPDTFKNVPLAQALHHLNDLTSFYFNAYQQLIFDMNFPKKAQSWPVLPLSVSEGGIALFVSKRFRPQCRYDVYLHFKSVKRTIKMEASLVRQVSDRRKKRECNGFDFIFPEAQYQYLIQLELDRYELLQAKQVYSSWQN